MSVASSDSRKPRALASCRIGIGQAHVQHPVGLRHGTLGLFALAVAALVLGGGLPAGSWTCHMFTQLTTLVKLTIHQNRPFYASSYLWQQSFAGDEHDCQQCAAYESKTGRRPSAGMGVAAQAGLRQPVDASAKDGAPEMKSLALLLQAGQAPAAGIDPARDC
jgi:hypothetical protein